MWDHPGLVVLMWVVVGLTAVSSLAVLVISCLPSPMTRKLYDRWVEKRRG